MRSSGVGLGGYDTVPQEEASGICVRKMKIWRDTLSGLRTQSEICKGIASCVRSGRMLMTREAGLPQASTGERGGVQMCRHFAKEMVDPSLGEAFPDSGNRGSNRADLLNARHC